MKPLRLLPLVVATLTMHATPAPTVTDLIYRADFAKNGLADWIVEQQPGGVTTVVNGELCLNDVAGVTVWLARPLEGPVLIRYRARLASSGRVSDLNCFWMASDPRSPDDLFYPGHGRTGVFETYHSLALYYVGYGGNQNTTTRFRRYDGAGARPLEPGHNLEAPPYLLKADHTYLIELVAAGGRARYFRDGECVFDYADPAPLSRGWFGFRTVNSHLRITGFEVWRVPQPSAP